MAQNTPQERLYNGIVKENPTLILALGMCPTLAVTTSAINGLGMGLTTTVVLALSNLFISLLRKIIPDKVRIPAFIVVIASFVTIMQMVLQGFIPFLYAALGIYIPLIVVNCIILGRAEAYASKNGPIISLFDGIGMGLGFTVALTAIGLIREVFGAGTAFGVTVMPACYTPIGIMVMAPGAFFVLAGLTALQNYAKMKGEKKAAAAAKAAAEEAKRLEEEEKQKRIEAAKKLAEERKAAAEAKKAEEASKTEEAPKAEEAEEKKEEV